VIAIASTSIAYLHSTSTSRPNSQGPLSIDRTQVTGDFVTYDFVSPSMGWALDYSEVRPPSLSGLFWVFRTADSGAHWQKQLTGRGAFRGFGSLPIQVIDQSHVFVLVRGLTEGLYRTIDGGSHWRLLGLPRTQIEEIEFLDPEHGWLLTQPTPDTAEIRELYQTGDAGDTWQRLPDAPADAYVLRYRSAKEVWMSGFGPGNPHVYTSNNAGQTWQRHDLPPPPGQTWDIAPTGSSRGGIELFPASIQLLPKVGAVASVTASGEVYVFSSFDAGHTWKYVPAPPGSLAFEDALHWWAMRSTFLFKSSDAGQTWVQVADKLPNWQYLPQVLDSQHAWATLSVFGGYGLAFTETGGIHWTRARVPQPE